METFVVSYKESSRSIRSPLIAEGLALRSAVVKCIEMGFHRVQFQSDSSQLIQSIKQSGEALLNYMPCNVTPVLGDTKMAPFRPDIFSDGDYPARIPESFSSSRIGCSDQIYYSRFLQLCFKVRLLKRPPSLIKLCLERPLLQVAWSFSFAKSQYSQEVKTFPKGCLKLDPEAMSLELLKVFTKEDMRLDPEVQAFVETMNNQRIILEMKVTRRHICASLQDQKKGRKEGLYDKGSILSRN
ncbi:LOW QUALITY PROTEIN: hypothetical protein YC2023_035727 [Brassica napus]